MKKIPLVSNTSRLSVVPFEDVLNFQVRESPDGIIKNKIVYIKHTKKKLVWEQYFTLFSNKIDQKLSLSQEKLV